MYDKQYAARVKAVAATQGIADQVRIADESADGLSLGSAQLALIATIAIHDSIVIRPLSTPTTINP